MTIQLYQVSQYFRNMLSASTYCNSSLFYKNQINFYITLQKISTFEKSIQLSARNFFINFLVAIWEQIKKCRGRHCPSRYSDSLLFFLEFIAERYRKLSKQVSQCLSGNNSEISIRKWKSYYTNHNVLNKFIFKLQNRQIKVYIFTFECWNSR